MRVLTVYAHPNPASFCHAVLEQFSRGLSDAGHVCEVVDLYAIHFDPVFRREDFASYVHESMPPEILERMDLKQRILDAAGGPLRRMVARQWLRGKDLPAPARFIHEHRPKDVVAQWQKVRDADGLVFIAPVFWLHFPAILKGWFERVFSYGDAYALTMEGWDGQVRGRIPLLQHQKALVISTTLFQEAEYERMLEAPMRHVIDEWGLQYPGVKKVDHVYFYGVPFANEEVRHGYLDRAYTLGKGFAEA